MSSSESVPPSKDVDRDWMTVEQACVYLKVSRTTFDELKACGAFRGSYAKRGRLIRFHRETLNQALLKRLGGN